MPGTTQQHNRRQHVTSEGSSHWHGHAPMSGSTVPASWGSLAVRSHARELLDGDVDDAAELIGNYRDMSRANRWLGGARLTIRAVQRLTGHRRANDSITLVDVGTGIADIPRAVIAWGACRGLRVSTLGIDIDQQALRAGHQSGSLPHLRFAVADARHLPLAGDSVDIALSSMTLHHLDDDEAVTALHEMARVARLGIVVNDLTRSRHGLLGAWLLSRLTTLNRLTRHDAPLSVRRARTRDEMAVLARAAGLPEPVFDTALGYRVAMTIGTRPW